MRLSRQTLWLQPVAGGLGVGLMGFFVPEVLGVGYDIVERALNGDMLLKLMITLAVLKIIATALCYGSGNAGGIFGPALFIGAMIGGAVGSVAHTLFPGYTADPGAYALVGMGTAFAGIVRTPMTSVIMIFEVTRDYTIIVPLMISNLIAYFISYKLQKEPIYEALAHQDGVHLPGAGSHLESSRLQVSHAMQPIPGAFTPDTAVAVAAARMGSASLDGWPVVGPAGFLGMIRRAELDRSLNGGHGDRTLAEILSGRLGMWAPTAAEFPHVYPDQNLSVALERMGDAHLEVLPVVSRANLRELSGIVTRDDVLRAYGIAK